MNYGLIGCIVIFAVLLVVIAIVLGRQDPGLKSRRQSESSGDTTSVGPTTYDDTHDHDSRGSDGDASDSGGGDSGGGGGD